MRPRRIDLALQGGGTHGAFTWGVLDRLLEDERIRIGAISGSSAGAMNAVALAAGWTADGRRGARETLRRFWSRVAESMHLADWARHWLGGMPGLRRRPPRRCRQCGTWPGRGSPPPTAIRCARC